MNGYPVLYSGKSSPGWKALMGAVMYAGPQLAASPYAHLLEPAHWSDVQDMFMRDACALMGLSIESPLGGSTVFCILAVIQK
jgi:hypothetical protein